MEDWQQESPREPQPLRIRRSRRRVPALDPEDWRAMVKLGVQAIVVTAAALWAALVLGLSFGVATRSFCALAGCR